MRVLLFICLLILPVLTHKTFGQGRIISGKIVDKETNAPVKFAHVFLSNTTFGVTSNVSGEFEMKGLPEGKFILVVSFVGYEMFSGEVEITRRNNTILVIELIPKIVELEGVQVMGSTDKKWQRIYELFRREFIGETENADACEILNPWVVDFTEKSRPNNFSIVVSKPVEIVNKSLGYKIIYYLEEFIYQGGRLRYYGFPIFEHLRAEDDLEQTQWAIQREKTYEGSVRHFFYALVNNRCQKEGFRVIKLRDDYLYNSNSPLLHESEYDEDDLINMVKEIPSGREVHFLVRFNSNIEVRYRNESLEGNTDLENIIQYSRMKPLKPDIRCSRTGWVNILDFEVVGFWANSRVADLLPFEYVQP